MSEFDQKKLPGPVLPAKVFKPRTVRLDLSAGQRVGQDGKVYEEYLCPNCGGTHLRRVVECCWFLRRRRAR